MPLVSADQTILSSQAHNSFKLEIISTNLISISKLKLFLSNELEFAALRFILAELPGDPQSTPV